MRPRTSRETKLAQGRARNRAYVARLRERVREQLGCECQECGDVERLELAHVARTGVKGRGRGTIARLLDVLRRSHAYKLLCRRCHMDLDYAGTDPWEPAPPDPNQLELEEVPF